MSPMLAFSRVLESWLTMLGCHCDIKCCHIPTAFYLSRPDFLGLGFSWPHGCCEVGWGGVTVKYLLRIFFFTVSSCLCQQWVLYLETAHLARSEYVTVSESGRIWRTLVWKKSDGLNTEDRDLAWRSLCSKLNVDLKNGTFLAIWQSQICVNMQYLSKKGRKRHFCT